MIIILGLVILLAAVIVGLAGIFTNSGSTHDLTHGFAVFGYHVTGSTGTLFLYGIVVGAIGLLGLSLLLAGARRSSRRGRVARRGSSSPAARPPLPATRATTLSTNVKPPAHTRRASPETARPSSATTPLSGRTPGGTGCRTWSTPGRPATGRPPPHPLRTPPLIRLGQRNRPPTAVGPETPSANS